MCMSISIMDNRSLNICMHAYRLITDDQNYFLDKGEQFQTDLFLCDFLSTFRI